jgi:DNA polymerase III epsilon subunit-like protein
VRLIRRLHLLFGSAGRAPPSSICSFGLAVVEDGKAVRTESWLTRPPGELDWFDTFNIGLHGITPAMVKDAPPLR